MKLVDLVKRTRFGKAVASSPLRSRHWRESWQAARTLWFAYGHLQTVRSKAAIDHTGRPVPWYTYPAIEYLKQFDFAETSVFEYGSGNSTLFWAERARHVTSVEDDERWYAKLRPTVPSNCTLLYEPDLYRYPDSIARNPDERFDIIVVDGPARASTRLRCVARAMERLRPGGLIILDNSDWLPRSSRALRDGGLLQVDMSGFIPIGGHTQTTSFFFDRRCELRPREGLQPHPSAGAHRKNWEPDPKPQTETGATVTWGDLVITGVLETSSLLIQAPEGPRRFDIAICQSKDGVEVRIFDCSAGRIVLANHFLKPGIPVLDLQRRLAAMSWDEFCEFIRRHPMRLYVLRPVKVPV
jgi:hypothetical protein